MTDAPFVSTGHLPPDEEVGRLVAEAYAEVSAVDEGEVSQVYPALARAPRGLFGIAVAGVGGRVHEAGDAGVSFTIMSVAKPFVFALVCDAAGTGEVRRLAGANATGLPLDSTEAVERSPGGRTNPMARRSRTAA